MERIFRKLSFVALAAVLAGPALAADPAPAAGTCPGCAQGQGPGRMGWHGPGRRFDPKTVTTVQGKIQSVDVFQGRRGHGGVHLTLAVGSDTVQVMVGPSFYVDQQPVKLATGDTVEVKGSRLEGNAGNGGTFLVAQEIRKDGQVLALRDADGAPLWAPWRQGQAAK